MAKYKTLERPVANESDAVILKFGLTLQQIMDVVSVVLYIEKQTCTALCTFQPAAQLSN